MKTKQKPNDNDFAKDDEALREAGMREGTRKAGKWKMRPCVPGTISIIRSNMLEKRDEFWFVAAFAFVHIAPLEDVLAVDADAIAFNRAVRHWQLDNLDSIAAQDELSAIVGAAWNRVNAAETKAQHQSPGSTTSGK